MKPTYEMIQQRMRETLARIEQTLTIPAAEYVPAIGDVFEIIAKARADLDREPA